MHSEPRLSRTDSLPIHAFAQEIVRRISIDKKLVLVAETGSGKTTQVPQILLKSGVAGEGRIVVLQPRRLAARAVARRVAFEMGVREGGLVGYRTRYERVESAETKILFMTDGLFVRLAQGSSDLKGINVVVLDEFHERGISTDLAAGMVRRLQSHRRSDLRVAIMSATLDAARLGEVFGVEPLSVPGRMHPVDIRFLGDVRANEDVIDRAVTAVVDATGNLQGDGLVFLPGRNEIQRTVDALRSRLSSGVFDVMALHGGQSPEEQDRALNPSDRRKIVIATNVAETSLTIPGVRFVVDSGLARVHRFDPLRDLNALKLEPISQASARQRAGRAGRTAPGVCLRLWSESTHNRRAEFDAPEVHRIDLSEALLGLSVVGESDPLKFPWIDLPESTALDRALRVLVGCGAMDSKGQITSNGRAMAMIPAHPRLARALLEGARRGCADRAGLWAAFLSERDPFDRENSQTMVRFLETNDRPSDIIARERMFLAWRSGKANRISIDSDAAREVGRAADHLSSAARRAVENSVQESSDPPTSSHSGASLDEAIAESFMLGFPDRIAWRMDRQRPHAAMAGRRKVSIDKRSLHEGSGPLLAFEVRQSGGGDTAETTLSMTVALEKSWLEATLPHRFTNRVEERWEASSQSVEEIEEQLFDATVIERTVRPSRNVTIASEILASRMMEDGLRPDEWEEQITPWIARTRWVAETFPQRGLLTYTDDDLRILFAEIATGASRWNQVCDRPCLATVHSALSYEDQTFVQQMAPADIRLPSGYKMKLIYELGQPPRGSAKIQDFYGLDQTPCVAGGRVAVRLDILGPNRRPLQTTADLAGFWRVLYPEIRNELRRRYPRHEWR
ncbi:MAG: ATP-dependent helicase HrpB [Planctomycetota bacterium]|nr:ATP-dependent helicase HrpB [Planctomycetota bacterium]